MDDKIGTAIVSIVTAIIGVAILAVIVGQNAQTSNVINAAGTQLSNILKVAISPVT